MKKTLATLLALTMLLTILPLSVSAQLSAMIDSVTGSATGVAYDGTKGAYALTSPNFVVKSGDRTLNYSTLIMNEPLLYSNKACTSAYKLTTTPIPGTTYYTYVFIDLWENNTYDLTYDYDYIEDNFSFTLPGYDVAFYSLAEREMGSYLDITFTLTPKRSEIADVDLVADGLVFDEESDSYVPNITSTSIKDADGKAITNLDPVWHSGMYISGSFVAANKMDDDPEPGVTYYASVYVDLYKHGVYDYDYVGYYGIEENFSLTIPGYKVEFYDFMEREMGSYMDIKYKITRDVVEIGSVTGTATGVAHDGTLGGYALTNPVTSVKDINGKAITGLDDVKAYSLYTSNMYSNETKLTTEPQVGVTYYSSITVDLYEMNTYWLGYDYDDIKDNFSLTVPGYDVKFYALAEREMGSYLEIKFTLVRQNVATIVTQPKTGYAKEGEKVSVKVVAEGEGLTYQWYIKNSGSKKYSKSSVTKATYSATMSDKTHDRYAYCIITDKYGNQVKTKTVALRRQATITKEPATVAYAKKGAKASIKITAKGDGLKYTWYFRNATGTKYSKSSVTSATYSTTMSDKVKGRRVYCVVTDKYGKKVTSKTFLLREQVSLISVPSTSRYAKTGAKASVKIKASGDGLKYTWYIKNAGSSKYSKSSVKSATYAATMSSKVNGRRVYCVVTDKYGNKVQTKTFILKRK